MSKKICDEPLPLGETHHDFIDFIGGTNATARNHVEAQWNKYYFLTYQKIVHRLLAASPRGALLDVGTSHGNWFDFLRKEGFSRIYGVEISPERAAQARTHGYTEVFNCDAAQTPLPEASLDAAVSNDVFVHILRIEDKIGVLQRVEKLLKPGGRFILNHPSSLAAYNDRDFHIRDVCSFMSVEHMLRIVQAHTGFTLVDIRPTYYHWRFSPPPLLLRLIRRLVFLPLVPSLMVLLDGIYTRERLPIEAADTFYVALEKAR